MHDYAIDGVTLPNVRIMRDLGVIVDNKLSFSAHLAHITAKAHRRAGLISRSFKSRDPHILFHAFKVYVRRLIVEWCSSVWSPVSKPDRRKTEAVQRRFTKRSKYCSRLSYAERLNYMKDETLELRRLKQDLITILNNLNNLSNAICSEFFEFNTCGTNRGHSLELVETILQSFHSHVVV
jgi:hypothetical protein